MSKLWQRMEVISPWHFIWISIVASELLTAVFNAAQSYFWWGRVPRELLLIGAIDALLVPLLVAPAAIYYIRQTARLEKTNDRLSQEIEDRKQAEKALASSEARYRAVIDAFDGFIYICSQDYRIEFMNARLKERTGRDATGEPCFQALHDRNDICPWCVNERVFNGEIVRSEVRSPKDNRWYFTADSPVFNADGTVSKQAMIMDITDRKNMEEELLRGRKLESIGLLAGGIAHDFNNLLMGILSNIELVKMEMTADMKVSGRLEEAERAAYRAKDLTLQLLTFSKGGAPAFATLDIADVIRESAELALSGSNVKSEYSIPGDLWPVEADAGQMGRVISNLVINALQSMPEGGIITIACENAMLGVKDVPLLKEGKYVKVTIQDHGIGIPPDHLPKIFDPYFTTKQSGSGLGLATVYSIIKKHRGTIIAESVLGEGSTFYIYLPASGNTLRKQSVKALSDQRSSPRAQSGREQSGTLNLPS